MRTIEALKGMENYRKVIDTLRRINVHGTVYISDIYFTLLESKPLFAILVNNADYVEDTMDELIPELSTGDLVSNPEDKIGFVTVFYEPTEDVTGFVKVEEF